MTTDNTVLKSYCQKSQEEGYQIEHLGGTEIDQETLNLAKQELAGDCQELSQQ